MNAGAFGLCDLLKGAQGGSIDTAVQQTNVPGVWLLPAGNPTDEAPLLLEENLPALLTLLKQKMDMIIIDGPAILTGAIAPLLASMVDGVALVVDSRNDNLKTLRQVKELLQMLSDAPAGIILNRLRRQKRNAYYFTAPATPEELAQPATVVDERELDLVG
jgi:Mrp family chromosome partitioning ATPase